MKKILFAILALIMLTSCEGPMGPMGPEGWPGEGNTNYVKETVTIRARDWEEVGHEDGYEHFYRCPVEVRSLNSAIFTKGSVNVKHVLDFNGNQNYVKTPLPYVRHNADPEGFLYTQTISYEYEVERVTIFIETSDFFLNDPNTIMKFEIELIWPAF